MLYFYIRDRICWTSTGELKRKVSIYGKRLSRNGQTYCLQSKSQVGKAYQWIKQIFAGSEVISESLSSCCFMPVIYLGDDAYGVPISRKLEANRGRDEQRD